ncbi:MAG: hypothetical protein ABI867_44985, partial [Kofleriaceae bacterium]
MRDARRLVLLTVLATIHACGGKKPPTPAPSPGSNVAEAPKPIPPPTPPVEPPVPQKANTPPEVFAPAWKKVGVGQTIHFSVAAIDQDLDDTRVMVTAMPKSARFDALTQTVSWTPVKADLPKASFTLEITQESTKYTDSKTWVIEVDAKLQPPPVAEVLSPLVETVLMVRQSRRLEQVNKDWPLDKLLLVGAETFKYQIPEDKRATLAGKLDKKELFTQFLSALAQTHNNPRLDPKSPKFDKAVFGDPAAWRIVAFRPRIDRAWTELRVVYRAVKAPEATYAMFRLRPTVEYVPALPRPDEERTANNKAFLGMVQRHLMPNGGPSDRLMKDQAEHGKAVSALMTELMEFDESKTKPYLRGFMIGIALEAQMGGGSTRNADGSYKAGDAWGWSAMKPFQTADGKTQQYVNVIIPGFWTQTVPINNKTWGPACAPKYTKGAPGYVEGYEVLCRKTLGFVDLPDTSGDKVKGGRIDANNLYREHKLVDMVRGFPLEDGRRDLGEENGMTCSQCHIRNFAMHDYGDPANLDPSKGTPKGLNKSIATLNFQIVPSTHWEQFTLEFLKHQECRGKERITEFLG